mmetsp:Transcript_22106/g.43512  ORF Transcript_22106/g.43512 Transcript_22106/m.43512 type:complete len:411 (+) Transcript_22106:221-1453(+)|eukprot:CAMPEP_0171498018 /NCGR_PEP_ID=MMETSP0958-20121227/7608_1 /TAXON_ID=87120 /ORGANISM="Aurantiochytrium limacinum, Strain ATCCMYA-1381" /LENGTH=410 /DNA_ID=CAMNT_0012032353 /DNA_START=175 /DNA_END=1407 /DNA_ORIENTATION=-
MLRSIVTLARTTARREVSCTKRSLCTTSSSSSSKATKNREIAEKLAAKRREKDEALLRDAEGGTSTLGWLLGLGGVAGVGAFFTFHPDANKWFMQNVYKGTPLGDAVDWASDQVKTSMKSFTDPISDKLLPDFPADTLPAGMTQPMTLVLDFEDTLCHLEWDSRHGWRAAKRPGADYFLNRLAMFYEIVLFTSGNSFFLEPFVYSLDTSGVMQSKLFREATVYENGEHIKDLSHLNRPLERVIMIDDKPEAVPKQSENLIPVKPFNDPTQEDRVLYDLVPFLEDLAMRDPEDVRRELAKYKGKDIGAAFKQELMERNAQREQQQRGTLGGAIRKGALFGGPAQHQPQHAEAAAAPQPEMAPMPMGMTPIDQANNLPPPGQKAQEEEAPAQQAAGSSGTIWSMLGLGGSAQ